METVGNALCGVPPLQGGTAIIEAGVARSYDRAYGSQPVRIAAGICAQRSAFSFAARRRFRVLSQLRVRGDYRGLGFAGWRDHLMPMWTNDFCPTVKQTPNGKR